MTLEEASSRWEQVRENHTVDCVTLGPFVSYQLRKTPRRLIFVLSRYKFAAKLIGENKRILEVGSSEGLGAVILGEFAEKVVGIDIDH
ncbi:MAG: class I SAM-dependent methyltransferase, partial [Ignavibacteriales bacterium]